MARDCSAEVLPLKTMSWLQKRVIEKAALLLQAMVFLLGVLIRSLHSVQDVWLVCAKLILSLQLFSNLLVYCMIFSKGTCIHLIIMIFRCCCFQIGILHIFGKDTCLFHIYEIYPYSYNIAILFSLVFAHQISCTARTKFIRPTKPAYTKECPKFKIGTSKAAVTQKPTTTIQKIPSCVFVYP